MPPLPCPWPSPSPRRRTPNRSRGERRWGRRRDLRRGRGGGPPLPPGGGRAATTAAPAPAPPPPPPPDSTASDVLRMVVSSLACSSSSNALRFCSVRMYSVTLTRVECLSLLKPTLASLRTSLRTSIWVEIFWDRCCSRVFRSLLLLMPSSSSSGGAGPVTVPPREPEPPLEREPRESPPPPPAPLGSLPGAGLEGSGAGLLGGSREGGGGGGLGQGLLRHSPEGRGGGTVRQGGTQPPLLRLGLGLGLVPQGRDQGGEGRGAGAVLRQYREGCGKAPRAGGLPGGGSSPSRHLHRMLRDGGPGPSLLLLRLRLLAAGPPGVGGIVTSGSPNPSASASASASANPSANPRLRPSPRSRPGRRGIAHAAPAPAPAAAHPGGVRPHLGQVPQHREGALRRRRPVSEQVQEVVRHGGQGGIVRGAELVLRQPSQGGHQVPRRGRGGGLLPPHHPSPRRRGREEGHHLGLAQAGRPDGAVAPAPAAAAAAAAAAGAPGRPRRPHPLLPGGRGLPGKQRCSIRAAGSASVCISALRRGGVGWCGSVCLQPGRTGSVVVSSCRGKGRCFLLVTVELPCAGGEREGERESRRRKKAAVKAKYLTA